MFDLKINFTNEIFYLYEKISFEIVESKLNSYINNSLINEQMCIKESLIDNTDHGLFKNYGNLDLGYSVKYSRQTCPLIFQNSFINSLTIYGLSDSLIKYNILGFVQLNKSINSNINSLYLTFFKAKLDKTLFERK